MSFLCTTFYSRLVYNFSFTTFYLRLFVNDFSFQLFVSTLYLYIFMGMQKGEIVFSIRREHLAGRTRESCRSTDKEGFFYQFYEIVTDGPTDRRTDKASYRDASSPLKMAEIKRERPHLRVLKKFLARSYTFISILLCYIGYHESTNLKQRIQTRRLKC